MKKSSSFTATAMRRFLSVLLVLLIAGAIGGFYYGLQIVRSFAVEVSHSLADADASGKQIEELQRLKRSLSESETLVTKANQLFTTEANYQSQALTDVQRYASAYGLVISSTNFDAQAEGPESPILGLGKRSFKVTLESPVPYDQLLRFLTAVESNLPKMQISSITLGKSPTNSASVVMVDEITIEVSTR